MTLIILLIALGVERYLHVGNAIFRFDWFPAYMGLMRGVFGRSGLWYGFPLLIIALLPILVAVGIIWWLFAWILFGFAGFLLSVILLIYCLGPRDLYTDLEKYFIADVQNNTRVRDAQLQYLLDSAHVSTDPEEAVSMDNLADPQADVAMETATDGRARQVTKSIFQQALSRLFGVVFWFVVLGPGGALLYRLIEVLQRFARFDESEGAQLLRVATFCLDVLNWIPVRCAALAYAFVGNFHHGFAYWWQRLFTGIADNDTLAVQSGLKALHLSDDNVTAANVAENKAAMALVDHGLVFYLTLIAIFILGAWVY